MTFCRSIYVKKVMKLLAFIFEQPSYHQSMSEDIRIKAIDNIRLFSKTCCLMFVMSLLLNMQYLVTVCKMKSPAMLCTFSNI